MYVNKRQVTMHRGIATLLAIALVLWAVGTHMFNVAEASNLISLKDTLSDSNPGSVSNHTIEFTTPHAVASGQTIVVTFPNGFNISTSSVLAADIDLAVGGVDQTLVDAAPGAAEWDVGIAGQDLTFTSGGAGATVGATTTIAIEIGSNATFGAAGANKVTNHSAVNSYEFTVTTGTLDSGQSRIAIIDNVLVTANVNTTLTFTVNGTSTAATINGSPTTTATTSTSTTLPFETLADSVSKVLGQDLTVATNARNGYVVTVEQSGNLQSTTGADIDGFIDGAYTDTPAAWVAPSNNINNENTWGHWGLTTTDVSLLGAGADFASDQWVAASTTPRAIMAHSGPADGTTQNIGRATVGYQVQITALQEAGDDYSTTLTYIATPTF